MGKRSIKKAIIKGVPVAELAGFFLKSGEIFNDIRLKLSAPALKVDQATKEIYKAVAAKIPGAQALPEIAEQNGRVALANKIAGEVLKPLGAMPKDLGLYNVFTQAINEGLAALASFFNVKLHDKEKHINDPKFYTNLDMHQEFRIPLVYPDTLPLVFGDDYRSAAVCLITTNYNFMADKSAIYARTYQTMDLLKAVRGLSGKLPYSANDLIFYQLTGFYAVNEYCKLKFALRLSQFFTMSKTKMPRNLMAAIGFSYDDFVANRALYVDALTNLANFITNNLPVTGLQLARIYSVWDKLIPDSNDGKVALYYKLYNIIECFIPTKLGTYTRFTDKFVAATGVTAATFGDIQTGMTYAVYINNMLAFMTAVGNQETFAPIRADMIGAFGSSAIWNDAGINKVSDFKTADILGGFDELFLTVIQNATNTNEQLVDHTNSTSGTRVWSLGIRGQRSLMVNMPILTSGSDTCDPTEMTVYGPNNNNAVVQSVYSFQSTGDSNGRIFYPAVDGLAAGSTNVANYDDLKFTDNLTVLSNKYSPSEGESLEILQLMAYAYKPNANPTLGATSEIYRRAFVTQTTFVSRVQILYTGSNGADQSQEVMSRILFPAANNASVNEATFALRTAQFWSQSDYGMKLHIENLAVNENFDSHNILLDFNIMGSLSKYAFIQSIRYATYSLYSANIKLDAVKKINNIVDVYSIKK